MERHPPNFNHRVQATRPRCRRKRPICYAWPVMTGPSQNGGAVTEADQNASPPATRYQFTFEPHPRRVRAQWRGITLADSTAAMVMRETRLPPVFYFPRRDVRMDLMTLTDYVSHCPFKGNAHHYSVRAGEQADQNIMWSYEQAVEDAPPICDYVAFYADRIDEWFEDEIPVPKAAQEAADIHVNPLAQWLIHEAPELKTPQELTVGFAKIMCEIGVPLWRMRVVIQDLHPQLVACSYAWWAKTGELTEFLATYEQLLMPEYLNSPLVPIQEGAGGIRRRLDIPDPRLDFGILRDLHAEGGTDYVAMPMLFSDGQINVLTLSSNKPGGFSTSDLGHIYEILAMLGRLYEVHSLHRKSVTLLDTYIGPHAGRRVLQGLIKRGDGESINAVIWFCDLRESTPLAQSVARDEFLACLNRFFDCTAGAVIDHGGQVLRFIGDAALAIFQIEDDDHPERCTAYGRALDAVLDAVQRLEKTNRAMEEAQQSPLKYGIALHVGELTYGNIGTGSRLEFTVIGDAANRAARLESMCKTVGEPVLFSADFARHFPGRFASLGFQPMRGVDEPQEVFAMPRIDGCVQV